jgi:hypothetical protein
MNDFDSAENRAKFGYPGGMFYIEAFMYKPRMYDWIDDRWSPYTSDTRHGGLDTYLIMDEFSVLLVGEINHKINKLGIDTKSVPSGYIGNVQVIDKSVSKHSNSMP